MRPSAKSLRNEEGQTEARQPKVWPYHDRTFHRARSWRRQAYHNFERTASLHPLLLAHNTTETIFLSAIRRPLNAIVDCGNDGPDLVGASGGWGREIGAGASWRGPAPVLSEHRLQQ